MAEPRIATAPVMNNEQAGRSFWLVKVPHSVAEKWNAVCAKAAVEQHVGAGPKLGTMRIIQNAEDSTGTKFELNLDNDETVDLPQEYTMKAAATAPPSTLAFCDKGERVAASGVMVQRFDVEPTHRGPSGASGPQIDAAYRKLSRERHQAADTHTRTVQRMSDPLITNIRRPIGALVGQKRKGDAEKRVALPAEELQALLFRKFERQAHWSFAQLQKETEQPTAHLKEVLLEIALQNKRGPYKDLWELKKEFKTRGAEPQAPQQQQQQS